MRFQRASYNIVAALTLQTVQNVTGFILPRLVLANYGSAVNGLLSSTRQLLKYLSILEMGITGAAVTELYHHLPGNNDAHVAAILEETRRLFRRTALLFLCGSLLLAVIYPWLVDCKPLPKASVSSIIFLFGLSNSLTFLLAARERTLLVATQCSYVISFGAALSGSIALLILSVALWTKADILIVPIITVLATLLQAGIVRGFIKRRFGHLAQATTGAPPTRLIHRNSVIVNELAYLVENGAPIVISTTILGLVAVSIFSVYNMFFQALEALIKTLPRALQATFGEVANTGSLSSITPLYSEYERSYALIASLASCLAAAVLPDIVHLYTIGIEDAAYFRPDIGFSLAFLGYARQLRMPASTLIAATGRFAAIQHNAIWSATNSLVLGFTGAYFASIPGLLVGVAIGGVFRTVYIARICYRHVLTRPFSDFFKNICFLPTLLLLSVLPLVYRYAGGRDGPPDFLETCATAGWICLVHFASFLILPFDILKSRLKSMFLRNPAI